MEFLAGRKLRGKPALRKWQNSVGGQSQPTAGQAVRTAFHVSQAAVVRQCPQITMWCLSYILSRSFLAPHRRISQILVVLSTPVVFETLLQLTTPGRSKKSLVFGLSRPASTQPRVMTADEGRR